MTYSYNAKEPIKISTEQLSDQQKNLIFENKSFCMLPWIHLHSFPAGEAYPCCNSEMSESVGNTSKQSLEEIWNDTPMRDIRKKMTVGETVKGCTRCYEQEDAGFFSMRLSSNKYFGHHISLVDDTLADGTLPNMKIVYWDVRFSNLCNLKCRSCGHIFSSNWYDDQAKLIDIDSGRGDNWKSRNQRMYFAGRNENDMWEQLEKQIDNLEQVYFAGGEPLIMEEHYRLLNELIKRGRTDVRLIYNTNFTEITYKKFNVLDMWSQFKDVSVGASLDGMGAYAEYIRKNTKWDQVEKNREAMLKTCPNVDFYVSPTLSIMNLMHLPDFHKDWVAKGFLKPKDLNVNILQDPPYFRIDIAPEKYKQQAKEKYQEHINWLEPQDPLTRATIGFKSAVSFMGADDKTDLIPKFWDRTNKLDSIRNENILDIIPELKALII